MKILIAVEDNLYGNAMSNYIVQNHWGEIPSFKVINVVPSLKGFIPAVTGVSDTRCVDVLEERKRHGKSVVLNLGTALKRAFPQASLEEEVLDGDPKSKILDIAQEWQADHIVLGSHSRSDLERLLLGSVSQAVLSHATCSVTIVKLAKESEKASDAGHEANNHTMPLPA